MNKYTGEVPLDIHGIQYTLVYDWRALSFLKSRFSDQDLDDVVSGKNVDILGDVLAIGLNKKHPDITGAEIKSLSPPLSQTIEALGHALTCAYFGTEPPKKSEKAEKKTKESLLTRLLRHILFVSLWVCALVYPGVLHLGNFPSFQNLTTAKPR